MPVRLAVAFCHPDLGLGGAERLVVDAAGELASAGHTVRVSSTDLAACMALKGSLFHHISWARSLQVDVYTAHYDKDRCFEETKSGAFSVTVCGAWFPRNLLDRMHALCAYVRCILIAIHIAWAAFRCSSNCSITCACIAH